MTDQPYTLAVSCAQPDLDYPSLTALARAIVRARDELDPRADIVLAPAAIARSGELPGGACVSVRTPVKLGERGHLIGYAFLPGIYGAAAVKLLMDAVFAVGQPVAA